MNKLKNCCGNCVHRNIKEHERGDGWFALVCSKENKPLLHAQGRRDVKIGAWCMGKKCKLHEPSKKI